MRAASTTSVIRSPLEDSEAAYRRLRIVFQLSLYALVGLASVMLAWAEGAWNPIAFTLPLAFVAYFITGPANQGGVHLPPMLANVAGAVALFACYSEFSSGDQESRLLAGAHLIVYLMWIVLFQRKTIGTYWWMIALTMLQVAIGALLRQTGDYGVCLVVYSLVAMWTLSVFSVYRAYAEVHDAVEGESGARGEVAAAGPFAALRARSQTVPVVQLDERSGVLGLRFATGVATSTFVALCFSFLVFLIFPRWWIGQQAFLRGDEVTEMPAMTGFSETLRLGEVGRILESTERALEVKIVDDATDERIDVEAYARELGFDEPMFRGKVLDNYDGDAWTSTPMERSLPKTDRRPHRDAIRHEYRLIPQSSSILFAMQPVWSVHARVDRSLHSVRFATYTSEYHWGQNGRRETMEYVAFSPRDRGDRALIDAPLSPARRYGQLLKNDHTNPRSMKTLVPGIRDYVAEDREALAAGEITPAELAEKYVRLLRDSGEYGYTLEDAAPPRGTDPVEHFLFERKTGHCEYYASALCLMLREAGVPARIIIGFKGGTPNEFTGYFDIEQRHTHAWVEAYLTERAIDFTRDEEWEGRFPLALRDEALVNNLMSGEWTTLDATPAIERSLSVEQQARGIGSFEDLKRFVADQWDWFVVRMNMTKQADQIFVPIRDFAVDVWNAIRGDAQSRRELRERLRAILSSPGQWFSPVGFVVTFLLLTILYGLARVAWMIAGWLWPGAGDAGAGAHRRGTRVPFWERFVSACRRLGLEREPTQTQLEFATDVRRFLATRGSPDTGTGSPPGPETLPDDVVRDFYAVRFGGRTLPADRLAELENRLEAFESAVATASH